MYSKGSPSQAEDLLRRGLTSLPTPEVSPDFNARVHASLAAPKAAWRIRWSDLRPALQTAGVSLAASLLLLRWSATEPPRPAAPDRPPSAAPSIDLALDRLDLERASFGGVRLLAPNSTALRPRSGGDRRSALPGRPLA